MIEYVFVIDNGEIIQFHIDINRKYDDSKPKSRRFWTELEYYRCENCPMSMNKYRYCPAAVDLQEIIEDFSSLISYERATVTVKTPDRNYVKTCDIQTGLQSALGLVMATSECPILSKLKTLAYFHLPFGTMTDTIFRAVGAYLIQQYFIFTDGGGWKSLGIFTMIWKYSMPLLWKDFVSHLKKMLIFAL